MLKKLWNSFIPTPENDYRPYFLRAWPLLVVFLVIVGLYGGVIWAERSLTTKGGWLAAVVSSVLVDLANVDRTTNGLHGLSVNPTLVAVAQAKADDMAAKSYFAHTSPEGKSPWHWFNEAGYNFAYAGENLAVYFSDSADVERAWMNSPGHRANILSPYFTEIGIAVAQGMYQGQQTTFVVQMFGTPLTPIPPAVPAPLAAAPVHAGSAEEPPATVSTVSPQAATTTPAVATVKGEETISTSSSQAATAPEEDLTVVHEDEQFIAVKNASSSPGPSAYSVSTQSTFWQRLLTSPKTTLSYAYTAIALIVFLALVFMVVFEIHEQRPINALLALLVIAIIALLIYLLTHERVLVESAALAFLATGF